MYSKVKAMGHPIHPMIVAFPIVFYTVALFGFFVFQYVNHGVFWYRLAYFGNFVGVFSAIAAAIPGFIDWAFGIPRASAAKNRGFLHMILNVTALIFFSISLARVWGTWDAPIDNVFGPLVLSLFGVGLTMVAGYHGWELVATHKVGVSMTPEQERIEPTEKMSRREHELSPGLRTTRPGTAGDSKGYVDRLN